MSLHSLQLSDSKRVWIVLVGVWFFQEKKTSINLRDKVRILRVRTTRLVKGIHSWYLLWAWGSIGIGVFGHLSLSLSERSMNYDMSDLPSGCLKILRIRHLHPFTPTSSLWWSTSKSKQASATHHLGIVCCHKVKRTSLLSRDLFAEMCSRAYTLPVGHWGRGKTCILRTVFTKEIIYISWWAEGASLLNRTHVASVFNRLSLIHSAARLKAEDDGVWVHRRSPTQKMMMCVGRRSPTQHYWVQSATKQRRVVVDVNGLLGSSGKLELKYYMKG